LRRPPSLQLAHTGGTKTKKLHTVRSEGKDNRGKGAFAQALTGKIGLLNLGTYNNLGIETYMNAPE
jgi:hypothetical protein